MELYLSRLGRFQSDGRFELRQAVSVVSVHVIAEGHGHMICDGRSYEVGAGDLFVFFPNQHLHYFDNQRHPWRYTWFVLDGTQPEAVLAHCGLTRDNPHRPGGATAGLETLFCAAEEALRETAVSPLSAAALGWRLAQELEPHHTPQPCPTLTAQARFLFDNNYGTPLTVGQLAVKLNVSRTTLFRAFQAELGRSPKQVLDDLRMQRAIHLLRSSKERVKEIAAACGYASEAYFSRTFKAHTGLPPGQWRKRR